MLGKKTLVQTGNPTDCSGAVLAECIIVSGCLQYGHPRYTVLLPNGNVGVYCTVAAGSKVTHFDEAELYCTSSLEPREEDIESIKYIDVSQLRYVGFSDRTKWDSIHPKEQHLVKV